MKKTTLKKKTIERLAQRLHEELAHHPNKNEVIRLTLAQLADDTAQCSR
jgi:hypothetical protein